MLITSVTTMKNEYFRLLKNVKNWQHWNSRLNQKKKKKLLQTFTNSFQESVATTQVLSLFCTAFPVSIILAKLYFLHPFAIFLKSHSFVTSYVIFFMLQITKI